MQPTNPSPNPKNNTFRDETGREWRLSLNVTLGKRIRDDLGVDLVNAGDGRVFVELASDWLQLGAVLWMLCERQADEAGVTPDQFGELLTEQALEQAVSALVEAVVSFTPPARRRALRAIAAKAFETAERADERMEKKASSPEAERLIKAKLDELDREATKRLRQATPTASNSTSSTTGGSTPGG